MSESIAMSSTVHHIGEPSNPITRRKRLFAALPPVRLVLPNTGSVARDHLASERTWLSYVHTSLGVVTMGVALVQLFTTAAENEGSVISSQAPQAPQFARPVGSAAVFLGLYILGVGTQRFFYIQHSLTREEFPTARLAALSITCVLAALICITFAVVTSVSNR